MRECSHHSRSEYNMKSIQRTTLLRKSLTFFFVFLVAVSLWGFSTRQHVRAAYASPQRPAENNGAAQTPFMGWSSWNFIGSHPTEANIEAQAQAEASQLKSHGYNYILLDDFWYLNPSTTVDQYGRWTVDTSKFPNGLSGLASYIHGLGLKVGFYLTPGIPVAAVKQNTPIEGTSYHAQDIANTSGYEANYNYGSGVMYYINYSKPGAQAYINSWANQLASWGADFLKLDGVGDGDISDIQAWSQALQQSGRSIVFNLSNSLDVNNGSLWKQYSNAWRIDGDVECYCSTQVTWSSFSGRFNDTPPWTQYASSGGWNDLDALQIADGSLDGISNDERQTYMTLWAVEAAPLYAGDDLTHMDSYGLSLLTNDEVIAVDQAGHAAHPVSQGSSQQVWFSNNGDGTYTVALFNLSGSSANVIANWNNLGFTGSASVRDLWSHSNLGSFNGSFSATLNSHASRLLKVTPGGSSASTSYEAESSANTLAGGAIVASCSACSGGQKIGNVGNGGTLKFNNVNVANAGTYILNISYVDADTGRSAQMSVNGGTALTLNFAGTNTNNWNNVQSLAVPVILNAGNNTILFSNSSGWAPDFDRITTIGSGYVTIVNRNSGKSLDVYGDSTADSAPIVQFTSSGQTDQQWSLKDAGGGYVKIVNRNSGKLLNIPGPTTTQGAQLIQFPDDGNSNSQWSLSSLSAGYYAIVSRYDSQVVDVQGASTTDNAPVIQWANNGGTNQQWVFIAV
jgi:alpha-galactosidase